MERNKALAQKYIVEAQRLLPGIGIDDNPGDGGAEPGKILRDQMVTYQVRLAHAQARIADKAGATGSLARAAKACMVKGQPAQIIVDTLVGEAIGAGFEKEAFAYYKQKDKYGFQAPVVARKQVKTDKAGATQTLLTALENGAKLEKEGAKSERKSQLLFIADVAHEFQMLDVLAKVRELLQPFEAEMEPLEAAHAWHRDVTGLNPAEIEKRVRDDNKTTPAFLAYGLFYLKQNASARMALGSVKTGALPAPGLVLFLSPAEYVSLARKTDDSRWLSRGITYLKQTGRDTPQTVAQISEGYFALTDMAPYGYTARTYSDAIFALPPGGQKMQHARKLARSLTQSFAEMENDYRKHPATGEYERSARQRDIADLLASFAPLDPAFAIRHLFKVREPRHHIDTVVALARALS